MYEQYLREVKISLRYFGTWLPNAPLELGAVGTVGSDGHFSQVTSLAALLGAQPDFVTGEAKGPLKHHSSSGVAIQFKAAGAAAIASSALTEAEAGIAIEFTSENAIIFEALDCTVDRFTDIENIGIELTTRADAKLWRTDYMGPGRQRQLRSTIGVTTAPIRPDRHTSDRSRTGRRTARIVTRRARVGVREMIAGTCTSQGGLTDPGGGQSDRAEGGQSDRDQGGQSDRRWS